MTEAAKLPISSARTLAAVLISAIAVVALPDMAMADKFSNVLCKTRQLFSGQTGTAVATLAIIFLGVGAFFGKVSWGVALLVGVGIAAIFGADSIVSAVGGSDASTCP